MPHLAQHSPAQSYNLRCQPGPAARVESALLQPSPQSDFSDVVGFFPCHVFKYVDLIRLTKASLDAKFLTDFYD